MKRQAAGPAAIILLIAAGQAQAQSADASATIEAVASGSVVVTNTADLSFGTQPIGTIVHSSNVPTAASWNVLFNQTGTYSVAFTLPSSLVHVSTGAGVPILYGASSASSPQVTPGSWNPTFPIGLLVEFSGIGLDVFLGQDALGDGTGDVSVNLSGAAAGVYQGTITLTVAAQ